MARIGAPADASTAWMAILMSPGRLGGRVVAGIPAGASLSKRLRRARRVASLSHVARFESAQAKSIDEEGPQTGGFASGALV